MLLSCLFPCLSLHWKWRRSDRRFYINLNGPPVSGVQLLSSFSGEWRDYEKQIYKKKTAKGMERKHPHSLEQAKNQLTTVACEQAGIA